MQTKTYQLFNQPAEHKLYFMDTLLAVAADDEGVSQLATGAKIVANTQTELGIWYALCLFADTEKYMVEQYFNRISQGGADTLVTHLTSNHFQNTGLFRGTDKPRLGALLSAWRDFHPDLVNENRSHPDKVFFDQVRHTLQYRNWLAHGRFGTNPVPGITPQIAPTEIQMLATDWKTLLDELG